MSDSRQRDLTKIRILQELSEPANAKYGVTVERLKRLSYREGKERLLGPYSMLPELVEAGLVERRQDPGDNKSKPYFITAEGKSYLAEAVEKAIFSRINQRQDWAAQDSSLELQRAVAHFLRRLPEFQSSSKDRIDVVSKELARAISSTIGQGRS